MGFKIKSSDQHDQTFLSHVNGTVVATSWPELNQLQADIRQQMTERCLTMNDALPRRPLIDDSRGRERQRERERERRIWELQTATEYEVVCICGSMKFYDHMLRTAERLTLDGLIVLLPLVRKDQVMTTANLAHQSQMQRTLPEGMTVDVVLDAMHRVKIKMSSRIVVCTNTVGYFGESTRGEIQYAASLGKTIEFVRDTRGPKAGDDTQDSAEGNNEHDTTWRPAPQ